MDATDRLACKTISPGGKMMKKTLWVLLISLVILCAAGCGVEETQETTQPLIEVQVEYEEVVQQLPYQDVKLSLQSNWLREDPEAQVLLQAAAFFEKQTGAEVTIRWAGEDTGETDIYQLGAAEFLQMPVEFALDLTEMAEKVDYESKSHETMRNQITEQCGYLGAIAQTPYLGGIYYNTDVFAQCGITQTPRTWDDFLALSQKLCESGWQPLTLDQEDALIATELHLRRSIGSAEIVRLMSKNGQWHYDEAAIAALEQVMLYVQAGNIATGTPAEYPAGQNKMALSNSVMMIGTNADCVDVEEATLTDLSWGIFPYPGSTGSGTWMSADVLVIHRDSQNAQAAFDFVMLLTTGEFDQLRADISGGIPADPANASSVAGAMQALEAAQPEPLGLFGDKQLDVSVKLWSGWYTTAVRYASRLEWSK